MNLLTIPIPFDGIHQAAAFFITRLKDNSRNEPRHVLAEYRDFRRSGLKAEVTALEWLRPGAVRAMDPAEPSERGKQPWTRPRQGIILPKTSMPKPYRCHGGSGASRHREAGRSSAYQGLIQY
jgi:hypothetical protein